MPEPVTPTPPGEKQRRDTGVLEIVPPLANLPWVHDTMKDNLADAFRRSDKEFVNAYGTTRTTPDEFRRVQ